MIQSLFSYVLIFLMIFTPTAQAKMLCTQLELPEVSQAQAIREAKRARMIEEGFYYGDTVWQPLLAVSLGRIGVTWKQGRLATAVINDLTANQIHLVAMQMATILKTAENPRGVGLGQHPFIQRLSSEKVENIRKVTHDISEAQLKEFFEESLLLSHTVEHLKERLEMVAQELKFADRLIDKKYERKPMAEAFVIALGGTFGFMGSLFGVGALFDNGTLSLWQMVGSQIVLSLGLFGGLVYTAGKSADADMVAHLRRWNLNLQIYEHTGMSRATLNRHLVNERYELSEKLMPDLSRDLWNELESVGAFDALKFDPAKQKLIEMIKPGTQKEDAGLNSNLAEIGRKQMEPFKGLPPTTPYFDKLVELTNELAHPAIIPVVKAMEQIHHLTEIRSQAVRDQLAVISEKLMAVQSSYAGDFAMYNEFIKFHAPEVLDFARHAKSDLRPAPPVLSRFAEGARKYEKATAELAERVTELRAAVRQLRLLMIDQKAEGVDHAFVAKNERLLFEMQQDLEKALGKIDSVVRRVVIGLAVHSEMILEFQARESLDAEQTARLQRRIRSLERDVRFAIEHVTQRSSY